MTRPSTTTLLSLLAIVGAAAGAATNSTIACNNSPSLCDRKYNNVTYLGAHDSPFVRNATNGYSVSGNQFYNTTVQLSAGVRLVTAQVQTLNTSEPATSSNLHVCHTSCALFDAGTLSGWLGEVKAWMDANPNEVVTVLLVNGPNADASALAAEYEAAGLVQYAYTPAFTTATDDWPTLQELINQGKRVVTFVASIDNNAAAPYLLNEYNFMFENSYDNSAPTDFSCTPNAPSNLAGQATAAISLNYMSLLNHFLYEDQAFGIQVPNATYAATTNAPSGGPGNLGATAATCTQQYGKAPNYLVVDFFNMGPAIRTADTLNGVSEPVGRGSVSTDLPAMTSAAALTAVASSTAAAALVGTCGMLLAAFLL